MFFISFNDFLVVPIQTTPNKSSSDSMALETSTRTNFFYSDKFTWQWVATKPGQPVEVIASTGAGRQIAGQRDRGTVGQWDRGRFKARPQTRQMAAAAASVAGSEYSSTKLKFIYKTNFNCCIFKNLFTSTSMSIRMSVGTSTSTTSVSRLFLAPAKVPYNIFTFTESDSSNGGLRR